MTWLEIWLKMVSLTTFVGGMSALMPTWFPRD
jgi:hypothetical protein